METIYDFSVKNTKGEDISLKNYEWKVLLIVNTATKCGLTPQFDGLEKLWQQYGPDNFVILGFPCNQFAHQSPETDETVEEVCRLNHGVTFPLFARIDVNGKNESPLYTFLKNKKPKDTSSHAFKDFLFKLVSMRQKIHGDDIKWNFTKFLISKNGQVIARFAPTTEPKEMQIKIEQELVK